ncbi:hypothetical protein [Prevotella dentasini]|uniref:hypothetical protein n=1 Tax=Prevotella dentasini TaxID=589537 RepID=UPI0004686172|nr:hypothetical protein [Prevotella dentasini]
MKRDYLLPHIFRKIGWTVFVPSLVVVLLLITDSVEWLQDDLLVLPTFHLTSSGHFFGSGVDAFRFGKEEMGYELMTCLALASAYMICFSREKVEDEFVEHLRMHSLLWALKMNTVLFMVFTWFCFGVGYMIMVVLSMFSIFFFFHFRFLYELHKMRRNGHEE